MPKVVKHFFSPNFEKIASGLRPLAIFSKFGLIFMEDYKILQLAFIGRITGSGTAATGSGYWAVERLLTLPIGCDSCISSIIDWCFFGKSLVNGLQRKLIFTGCDTGATWRKRILAVRKWIFTGCKPFFLNSS